MELERDFRRREPLKRLKVEMILQMNWDLRTKAEAMAGIGLPLNRALSLLLRKKS